jgi:hypothetical protein
MHGAFKVVCSKLGNESNGSQVAVVGSTTPTIRVHGKEVKETTDGRKVSPGLMKAPLDPSRS